jgi:hypothetical protein
MRISPQVLSPSARLPANWAMVSGMRSSDEAKIGGITPAVLIFRGRCERSACICRGRSGAWDIG